FGVGTLLSGLMYERYDRNIARLQLEVLKEKNNEYYERVTGDEDSLATLEFYEKFVRKGNSTLVSSGFMLLAFAIITMIPVALVFLLIREKAEASDEEEKGEGDKEASEEEIPEF
ncbi:hypothetical protein ACFL47_09860, partial [Candidatus Latescibacterota bacterium]